MKKIFKSYIANIVALVLCYAGVYAIVCKLSWPFAYYATGYTGIKFTDSYALVGIIACLVSMIFLTISIWVSIGTENKLLRFLGDIDYMLFIVIVLSSIYIAYYTMKRYTMYMILISPVAAFLAGVAFFVGTVIRIRDKTFRKTMYWLDFFEEYNVFSPVGILMLTLLAGNCIIIFLIPISSEYNNMMKLIFSNITLIALTYFCIFVKSLSSLYQRANEDKIKSERFKSELITNVSHDIKTPLTSIINSIDLIKRLGIQSKTLEGYIEVMDRKSQRLKQLINDLTEASKASAGYLSVEPQLINLSELVAQIAGEYDQAFADRGLKYIFKPCSDETMLIADGRHLWRVMENIFGNAAKYSLPDTRVYAEILSDGKHTSFHLKNISQEPLDTVPDELTGQFVRGDRSRSTEGSGLGLFIAKSLTELMRGEFKIIVNGDLFEVILSWG